MRVAGTRIATVPERTSCSCTGTCSAVPGALQDLPSWTRFPLPQPELERDRIGFARYFDNHDGNALPPTWLAHDDQEYTQWVRDIKSPDTFHGNFQVWESRYSDPEYLSKLTLGQFGSELELGLHDWLHMRWAAVPRDPSNGMPAVSYTHLTLPTTPYV